MDDFILTSLWRATWQGTVLCLVVTVFVRWTPKLSPAIHCWTWRIVCLKMMIALLATHSIELPLLPEPKPSDPLAPAIQNSQTISSATQVSKQQLQLHETFSQLPPAESSIQSRSFWQGFSWPHLLLSFWILGVSFQLVRLIKDWRQQRHRLQSAEILEDGDLVELLRSEVIEAEMAMCPQLLRDHSSNCPAIIGTVSPSLLIPASVFVESDTETLRLLIRHELAHIRRRDLWWNWLAAFTTLMFYFHPATWWTLKQWKMSQESACDELALAGQSEKSADYASMLLKIAVSKNPSRSLTLATGIFESFETLKKRIENMAHFGKRSSIRVILAYSFVTVTVVGLLPWKIVSQQSVADQPGSTAKVDNSSTRKQVDGVWISVADVRDVSKMKHEIRGDFSRLSNKIQQEITSQKTSKKFTDGNSGGSGSGFAAGSGGGGGSVTVFAGRPRLAIALNVETTKPSQIMILKSLTGTDRDGTEYQSLPTSSTNFMVCPEFEKANPDFTNVYFPKDVSKVVEFEKLAGTMVVSEVASDSAEFKRLMKGLKKKTELGEYQITEMKTDQNGTSIAVRFPLPKSLRDALGGRSRNAAAFEKRVKARQMLTGMIRTEFTGSDGQTYRQSSRGSHGSGQGSHSSTSTTTFGRRTSGSGSFSSQKPGQIEYVYGFPNLPEGVRITGLKATVLEVPTKTETISFELEDVKLR